MAVECAECGVRSERGEYFSRVRRSFSRDERPVCPRCVIERFHRQTTWSPLLALVMLACSPALVFWWPDATISWVALYAGLACSCISFAVVPVHEAAHALAARALGLQLFGVTLGAGRLWRRVRVLGVRVELRVIPAGGFAHAAPRRAEGARWRMALIALAGPGVNVLLAVAAWPWLPTFGDVSEWRSLEGALVFACVSANALVAAVCLLPYRQQSSIGPTPSDGLLFWTALRAGPDLVRRWLVARYELEAMHAREDGEPLAALGVVRAGLAEFPDEENLISLLGVLLVEVDQGEEARSIFLRQLASEQPELERAITLSNVAWCDFLSGRDDRLEEADQCSEEAHRHGAWFAPIQSSRGAVLAWSGRAAEALPLLRLAFDGAESPADRACVACVQALAHRQLAQPDEAKQALELARTLDPTCPLLDRVN